MTILVEILSKFIFLFLVKIEITGSLTLTSIEFPTHVMLGQSVAMKCSYTKKSDQQIDSIKWYKDGREFYRVHPGISAGYIRQFEVLGVNVDTNTTTLLDQGQDRWQHCITIINTRLDTSGQYRCQITEARAPFHTEQQDRNLSVIIQPEGRGPRMKVNKEVVSVGAEVVVECWSDRSYPAADLQFFLNGNRVKDDSLGNTQIFRESDGLLESSYRRMCLKVRDSYSQKGVINVKCNAKIGEAYWQTSQENINVITKPSYMLESRSSSNTEHGNFQFAVTVIVLSQVFLCK